MTTLLYHILSGFILLLFALCSRLICGENTHHGLRRGYYLAGILLSIGLPFFAPYLPQIAIWPTSDNLNSGAIAIGELQMISAEAITAAKSPTLSLDQLLTILWLSGVAFLLLYRVPAVITLLRMHRQSHPSYGSKRVRLLPGEVKPFSFFGRIYLPEKLQKTGAMIHIFKHECAHVRGLHSADLLLQSLLLLQQWWNPAAWWIRRELRCNLEFLADRSATEGEKEIHSYQYELLQLATVGASVPLCNTFNSNHLKRRIVMMNKHSSPQRSKWSYLIALPVMLIALLGASSVHGKEDSDSAKRQGKEEIWQQDAATANPQKGEEQPPQFPGGQIAMMRFLTSHIQYPEEAIKKNIEGVTHVQIKLNANGEIFLSEIVKGTNPLLDKEALRVVNMMPRWEPAKKGKKNVPSQLVIPIRFKLNGEKKDNASPLASSVNTSEEQASDTYYEVVDEPASFPGGPSAMMQYMAANMHYPKEAAERNIQGRVLIQFIVEKDGKLSNIKVLQGVDPLIDKEAERVVSEMPAWIPGKNKGEPVRVRFTLPVLFRM